MPFLSGSLTSLFLFPSLLVCAAVFSLGHHLFYLSLNNEEADASLLGQETNVAIGSLFAFLVRVLLCITVGTAYTQVALARIATHDTLSATGINTIYGARTGLKGFLRLTQILASQPLLWGLAVLLWTCSIPTIVPPATLTLRLDYVSKPSSQPISVPTIDIKDIVLYNATSDANSPGIIYFEGSSDIVQNVANDILLSGVPRVRQEPMQTGQNLSYTVSFEGPSLRCQPAPSTLTQVIQDRMNCTLGSLNTSTRAADPFEFCDIWDEQPLYVTWNAMSNLSGLISPDSEDDIHSLPSNFSAEPMSFVASYAGYDAYHFDQCMLYSAMYQVTTRYVDGNPQTDNVLSDFVEGPSNVLTNWSWPISAAPPMSTKDLNYMALLDAFEYVLLGQMYLVSNDSGEGPSIYFSTSVASTALVWQTDLRPIGEWRANWTGALLRKSADPLIPATTGIENLFTNFIVSLLSEPSLTTNTTAVLYSAYPAQLYVYSSFRLWIAYGIALGLAGMAALIGFISCSREYQPRELTKIVHLVANRLDIGAYDAARSGAVSSWAKMSPATSAEVEVGKA